MLRLCMLHPVANKTFTEALSKKCDADEERINKKQELIDELPECSIKRYLRNNNEGLSGSLNKEIGIGSDRDLKNYTCVYQHGETLKKLLDDEEYLNLMKAVNKKRSNY